MDRLQLTLANQQLTEELKLQLGDRLPSVMSIAAKSMNMTMAEFTKAMEDGRLSAVEFMPAFTKAMREMAAPGLDKAFKSMQVSFNKMVQNGKLLVDAIFQSGVGELFTQIFNSLSDVFQIMQPILSGLFSFASTILKVIIFPIRLAIAMIRDVIVLFDNWLKDTWGTGLNEIMAGLGKVAGYIVTIFGTVGKVVGAIFNPIIKGIRWLFGKSPTVGLGKKMMGDLPARHQETIMGYGKAAKEAASTAGRVGSAVLNSRYTKAVAVGAAGAEAGQYIFSETKVEFTGKAADMLRQNNRESSSRTVQSNVRG